MRNRIKISLALLLFIVIVGCQKSSEGLGDVAALEMVEEAAPLTQEENITIAERKLIKTGEVRFETTDLQKTRKSILEAAKKYQGYVSSDREFESTGRKGNTLVIRVPSQYFDTVLSESLQGVESLEVKEIEVQDVTEEFLDAQARLKTKKELEIRYLELLKQAKNVTEMLEIEKQAGELRSEIESIEGRLQYLKSQVAYSTLTMRFYERIEEGSTLGKEFGYSFQEGWTNLVDFFLVLISIWPFILILVGLGIGFKMYRKKKRQSS